MREQQKQIIFQELSCAENCRVTVQGRILPPTEKLMQTGLSHSVAVIALGKGSAFSLLKVSVRNDMYNCFGASSFCVRDSFLQTLHYAFIDTHDKISFEIFGIGLFGECKKIFFAGRGVLYVLQSLRWKVHDAMGTNTSILSTWLLTH